MSEDGIDDIDNVVDSLKKLFESANQVRETMEGVADSVNINGNSPLKSVIKDEEKIEVVVEYGDGQGIQEVGIGSNNGKLVITIGGRSIEFDVPDDVDIEAAEGTMNNGIMTIRVPRE